MCGIFASISTGGARQPSEDSKHLLCMRGPDHVGREHRNIDVDDGACYSMCLVSTVLSLRGGRITPQPFTGDASHSVLCWNGEAWKIGADVVIGNDGRAVFDLLLEASSAHLLSSEATNAILQVIRSISGPYALVFLDMNHGQMYFGRDRLGRRSLLYNSDVDSKFLEFASIGDSSNGNWHEVEADAIYQASFAQNPELQAPHSTNNKLLSTSLVPICRHAWATEDVANRSSYLGTFNRAVPLSNHDLNPQTESVTQLRYHLSESLKLRILNVPLPPGVDGKHPARVAVLFSGGLDCTVLARMAHDILPWDQEIDLINVAFENPRVVQAAKNAAGSRRNAITGHGLQQDGGNQSATSGELMLSGASPFEKCPDRETGRKAFRELQIVCPGRTWRFVAVNVPYTDTLAHRARVVNLIRPHNTEMDLSIGYALYFAARGTGVASTSLDTHTAYYETPARVLLSGLGADELFGGYTRHATAFNRTGFPGLLDELKLDVDRLGKRNLGRDDRVTSHWGREARFPYLDETFVRWAVECPIWQKCGFQQESSDKKSAPDIEPGKKVLRLLAYELGMRSVAMEKKRAIQFGARTAKMETGRTKGTTVVS